MTNQISCIKTLCNNNEKRKKKVSNIKVKEKIIYEVHYSLLYRWCLTGQSLLPSFGTSNYA